ncbi:MAG TPA: hypothetical protein VF648_00620 [Pyrinomonadaceae bacterium]|jgi:hypothetical protein
MVISDNDHILFIESTLPASLIPIQDELTRMMEIMLSQATHPDYHTKGFHLCMCGAMSDNQIHFLPNGQETNSLTVHYLEFHRAEIPESELEKVRQL